MYLKKFSCTLDGFKLCVRETENPLTMDVRVVRKPRFNQALTIKPGTVMRLVDRRTSHIVQARLFVPRLRYGHLIAGGILTLMPGVSSVSSSDARPRGAGKQAEG